MRLVADQRRERGEIGLVGRRTVCRLQREMAH